jgi:hypothetical protein
MAKYLPEKTDRTSALARRVQWQVPSLGKEYEEICNYMCGMLCDPTCHAEECSSTHTRGPKKPLRNARLLVLSAVWNGNCSRVGECRPSV